MYVEEMKRGEVESGGEGNSNDGDCNFVSQSVDVSETKRVLIGAGARALFYPTLLYNVLRNKIQTEFRWWDRVDQFILLGAVPFPTDIPCLKELGVRGVITLNEPYETLVPTTLYQAHGIDHLIIPTRDYYFAPSLSNIIQAVDFIHENSLRGRSTYVHCKAGRGRSTTIVICYLVQYKQMTPNDAYSYVRSIRPRVLLASSQWQAVQEFYYLNVKKTVVYSHLTNLLTKVPMSLVAKDVAFDDGSVVLVTKSDLNGYEESLESRSEQSEIWADIGVVYRVRIVGQAAMARISCLWLRCRTHHQKSKLIDNSGCTIRAAHLEGIKLQQITLVSPSPLCKLRFDVFPSKWKEDDYSG